MKILKFTSIVGYTSCGPTYIESFLTIFGQFINVLSYKFQYEPMQITLSELRINMREIVIIAVCFHLSSWKNNMICICTYSNIFTIIGYITNSQLTIYPCDSSVDRALHWYRKVMGSNPVQAWISFFNCLSWKRTAMITISLKEYFSTSNRISSHI